MMNSYKGEDSVNGDTENGVGVNGDIENGVGVYGDIVNDVGTLKKTTKRKRNSVKNGCHFTCSWTVTRAILGRALLVIQVCLVINSLLKITHDRTLWWIVLAATLLGLIETGIVLFRKRGHEWKWFCPPVLFYLVSVVPLLWALTFDEINRLFSECSVDGPQAALSNNTQNGGFASLAADDRSMLAQISHQIWLQTFLIVIILARWILPKGGLSYDEISNLLFVYFASASDIMELNIFEIFDRSNFCHVDYNICYAIMGVWAASLIQFTFPLSAKKVKRIRRKRGEKWCAWFIETEIWGLALTVLLQDGPFFGVRMYCLLHYELYSYEIIFFTMKNALIVLLQLYRIGAILVTRAGSRKERKMNDRMAPLVASTVASSSVAHDQAYDTLQISRRPDNGGYANPALDL